MLRTRVNEIDLLRFCAALAVVVYHYAFRGYAADGLSSMPYAPLAPLAKYGYLGVELFFMISGFVVLMTAAASDNVRDFVISRVVRLYPAFWVCCTITYLVTLAFGAPGATTIHQFLMNLTMLSGLSKFQPIDGAYWSLLVEIRFYALVGVVIAIGRIRQAQTLLIIWLLSCAVLEVLRTDAAPLLQIPSQPLHYLRYLLIVDYCAYFVAGATCYLIWSKGPSALRFAMIAASWSLAISQCVPKLREFEKYFSTEMSTTFVVMIITIFYAILLLVSLRKSGLFARWHWPLAGAISYPLYLLHQNIGYIIFNHLYPALPPHLLVYGTVLFVIAAAYAVHVVIERRLSSRLKIMLTTKLNRRAIS